MEQPNVHPSIAAFLKSLEGLPPVEEVPILLARRHVGKMVNVDVDVYEKVGKVLDLKIKGAEKKLPARIYAPEGKGPFPIFLYFHGGGFVMGRPSWAESIARKIAKRTPCIVITSGYRLAPEHQWPAAPEDCYAATQWAVEHAKSFSGDPSRIAVGGASAGGNLATVVSMMARDRGGPQISLQALLYPPTTAWPNKEVFDKSVDQCFMRWGLHQCFIDHYLPSHEMGRHPYASPLLADDLADLPPAYVLTAEHDPLHDEGVDYARRLDAVRVPVEHRHCDGMIHGFLDLPLDIENEQEKEINQLVYALRRAFY